MRVDREVPYFQGITSVEVRKTRKSPLQSPKIHKRLRQESVYQGATEENIKKKKEKERKGNII